jgi:hypothetical protein
VGVIGSIPISRTKTKMTLTSDEFTGLLLIVPANNISMLRGLIIAKSKNEHGEYVTKLI